MTTEHQTTREEKTYGQLLKENEDTLSQVVRTIISVAESAAYATNIVHNYCFQPEEYDEAMEKMRLASADLTDREHELLAKIWRAALAAAASVDAEDVESLAGYRVYAADLHYYYRMVSGMIERTLQERKAEKIRIEASERKPVDNLDFPF